MKKKKSGKRVRIAVIGAGGIGNLHLGNIPKIRNLKLTAICDTDPALARAAAEKHGVTAYTDHRKLLKDHVADAVIIGTPHYSHTTIGMDAFKTGHHVLVEKPISVHKADCQRLIRAHGRKKLVFAAMFNQRTDPRYRTIRDLLRSRKLGELVRVTWIITDWFRTQVYYNSGTWRATWSGEGGGVLLNQCPHNLDLLQWMCGMPVMVRAFCNIGKRHKIEVEDEVTAYFEYANGATGTFITSTGEAPGTNRLEIACDKGKIVCQGNEIAITRNEMSAKKFLRTSKKAFATPARSMEVIKIDGAGGQHEEVLRNFADAITRGTKLIAPGKEGIHSVEFANAMLYSSITGKPAKLPLNPSAYEKMLKKLVRGSTFTKKTGKKSTEDFTTSFKK